MCDSCAQPVRKPGTDRWHFHHPRQSPGNLLVWHDGMAAIDWTFVWTNFGGWYFGVSLELAAEGQIGGSSNTMTAKRESMLVSDGNVNTVVLSKPFAVNISDSF